MQDFFPLAFPIVFRRENGGNKIVATSDPKDPGGYTRGGVSSVMHPEIPITQLTIWGVPQFQDFYRKTYWTPLCTALPWPLCLHVFDGEVNSGDEGAKAVQAALGLTQDGVLGPISMAAINKADPLDLSVRTLFQREQFYRVNRNWATYGEGWTARMYLNSYEAGQAAP